MSLVDNTGVKLFPMKFIKECIETYIKRHGRSPLVLVVAQDDWLDYTVSCTLPLPDALGLEIITFGTYLKPGEIDLAMGIKKEKP